MIRATLIMNGTGTNSAYPRIDAARPNDGDDHGPARNLDEGGIQWGYGPQDGAGWARSCTVWAASEKQVKCRLVQTPADGGPLPEGRRA